MPYQRPALSTLIARTADDIAASLPGANPLLRRAVLTILGRVLAGQHHQQFGYIDWLARNAVPFTARDEYLEGWAALKGVTRKGAIAAQLTVAVTGNAAAPVPSGQGLVRADGATFTAALGTTLAADGTGTLAVTADTAGSAGNCAVGTALTFTVPIAGVQQVASVSAATVTGADVETDDLFLSRMLGIYAQPPMGGALADYVNWALAVPGVTRAWCAGGAAGTGTVSVYFMMDTVRASNYGLPIGTNGVSSNEPRDSAATGDQLTVADSLWPLRSAAALVYAVAPAGIPLALTLAEVPNDQAIRGNIAAAIAGLLVRKASPGGVSLPSGASAGILRVSDIDTAIAAVAELDHFVRVAPAADVALGAGQISIPGPLTFQ